MQENISTFAATARTIALGVFVTMIALLAGVRRGYANDAFATVRCDGNVIKALIGKRIPNEPVAKLERKHENIGLEGQGGTEISESLSLSGWLLCGTEYEMLIERNGLIRDVIRFSHSRRQPAFVGTCENDGKMTSEMILAVLDIPSPATGAAHYAPGDTTLEPAVTAWRIDATRRRFVAVKADKLRCPRNGIYTIDGGP